MEVTMKSSYRARTGHDRTRFCKKSSNSAAQDRRERALARLRHQLADDSKRQEDAKLLSPQDEVRIKKEIDTLEKRLRVVA